MLSIVPEVGACTRFSKTVSESDVYQFAGITGDFARMHIDEKFMAETAFGARIAHGALLVGYMSRVSTLMAGADGDIRPTAFPVSLGFDKIRFLAPVFIGDTVTFEYRIETVDSASGRSLARIEARNQSGVLVAVATHVMKWVTQPDAQGDAGQTITEGA